MKPKKPVRISWYQKKKLKSPVKTKKPRKKMDSDERELRQDNQLKELESKVAEILHDNPMPTVQSAVVEVVSTPTFKYTVSLSDGTSYVFPQNAPDQATATGQCVALLASISAAVSAIV